MISDDGKLKPKFISKLIQDRTQSQEFDQKLLKLSHLFLKIS